MFVDENPHSHNNRIDTRDYHYKKLCMLYVCPCDAVDIPHCIHSHTPTHIPHPHTQINKCEMNSQIISESGNSGVSSGERSGGALILEPKTFAKEIKLIELIGMPYICCVHMFSISQTSKKHYNIYLYHTYVTTKSHWSTAVGCNYIEYTAPGHAQLLRACVGGHGYSSLLVCLSVCLFVTSKSTHLDAIALRLQYRQPSHNNIVI